MSIESQEQAALFEWAAYQFRSFFAGWYSVTTAKGKKSNDKDEGL